MVATRTAALNQLIAVRKGIQAEVHATVTKLHRDMQKPALLNGLVRTYRKIRDEDPDLPGERQLVQVRVKELLHQVERQYTRLWDVTAAVDWTNCEARADVVVDDVTVIENAPVSYLIFMEKQLTNLHTIVDEAAVLDSAERWTWNDEEQAWATDRTTTMRTKKEHRATVIVPPTEHHPAQVLPYQEDVPAGYWDTVKFSGALNGERRNQLLERIGTLREAVKVAREQANMVPAVQPKPAAAVFAYLLAT